MARGNGTSNLTHVTSEQWKPVTDFDKYEVSSFGFVRRIGKPVCLISFPNNCGYHRVVLRKNNKSHNKLVHILVANAFVGKPPTPRHEVNHIDTIKSNNRASNLEYKTRRDNLLHSVDRSGIFRGKKRVSLGKFLSATDRSEIVRRASHESQKSLAAHFGVCQTTISRILKRAQAK